MEIIMEVLFEMFLELIFLIVPEHRRRSKAYSTVVFITAVVLLLAVITLVIWGAVLISDYDDPRGSIPIVIAAVISIVVIVFGLVGYNKNH